MTQDPQTQAAITAKDLHFSYGEGEVICGLDLSITRGRVTTLIGANGCGKSTLLNLLTKNLKSAKGQIELDGRDIAQISGREFARKIAIVHQKNTAPADLTVQKLVEYGRVPYKKFGMAQDAAQDEEKVAFALDVCEIRQIKDRPVCGLSGGQMQRVWIAMALAQDTRILMLDEPTTYLDIRYQLDILHLVRRLNAELNMTVVMVLHDINQALAYSDEIIAMKGGRIIAAGEPGGVVSHQLIQDVFDVSLEITQVNGSPFVLAV